MLLALPAIQEAVGNETTHKELPNDGCSLQILEDRMRKNLKVMSLGGLALTGAMATIGLAGVGGASASTVDGNGGSAYLQAKMNPLNNSGGHGEAVIVFTGHNANVSVNAYDLLKGMPHAQHIHFGADARHECPSVSDDTNNDHRITTTEGQPAYGPIRKSLTTYGDDSPASALAVDRFPTTPNGTEHYTRSIHVASPSLRTAIKTGKAVIVIHGVDYNGNGKYDFRGAGASEIDPTFPAEATDPAVCGILRVQ